MRLHHPRFMYPPDPTDLHESGCRVGVSGLPAGSHLHSPEWPVDADFSQWHVGWTVRVAKHLQAPPQTAVDGWAQWGSVHICGSAPLQPPCLPACLR